MLDVVKQLVQVADRDGLVGCAVDVSRFWVQHEITVPLWGFGESLLPEFQ